MSAQRRVPTPPSPIGNRKPRKTRTERFEEVVPRRMREIRKRLDDLGNCAGSNYQYTEEQAQTVDRLLHEWVDITGAKFTKRNPDLPDFDLPTGGDPRRGKD
jgi:hypothetical protein